MPQSSGVRKQVVVAIAIAVAALHFVVGPDYSGPGPTFVAGYLIDITLPFALVLLLGVSSIAPLRPPFVRAALVWGMGAGVETLQYFGVPILGRTFDPLDYGMYGIGVVAAVLFERLVLSRLPDASAQ